MTGRPDLRSHHGMTHGPPDPQLDGIRRAFDSAFPRICSATTPADAEDEFSNPLNHMYRLNELGKNRLGKDAFHNKLLGFDDLRAARAVIWARTFDVHRVVAVAAMGDVFSDYFTAMFGVLVWKPLASLPEQTDSYDRHLDYASFLENRSVLGTSRRAFDARAALLPGPSGRCRRPGPP
jgi:hypothetical protein